MIAVIGKDFVLDAGALTLNTSGSKLPLTGEPVLRCHIQISRRTAKTVPGKHDADVKPS